MREFFDAEMDADAAHRERWRAGLDEAEQERITELYEADARAARGRGLPLRPGPAPLLRAHPGVIRPLSEPGAAPARRRILFTTSNGTGLGHLTRSMAIARRLDPGDRAALPDALGRRAGGRGDGLPGRVRRLIRDAGLGQRLPVVAPPARPAAGGDRRGRPGADRLRRHPSLRGPARRAAAAERRGLVPAAALEAGLEQGPAGPGGRLRRRARARRARRGRGRGADGRRFGIAPTGSSRSSCSIAPSCSGASEAAAELGLDPARPTILSPSARARRWREATRRTLDRLAAGDEVQVAALSSALAAADSVPEGVVGLRATYPMSRYFAAFDGAVAAAGYNAYHELIALGVPSLFVPMPRDTDDQPARARYAEGAGMGSASAARTTRPRGRGRAPARPGRAGRDPRRLGALPEPRGAAQAAAWLGELAAPDWLKRQIVSSKSTSRGGAREFRRRWGSFFASAPRTAVRLTTQQLTKPRARALVFAVGVPPDERGRRGHGGGRRGRRGGRADAGRHRRARRARRAARARRAGSSTSGGGFAQAELAGRRLRDASCGTASALIRPSGRGRWGSSPGVADRSLRLP